MAKNMGGPLFMDKLLFVTECHRKLQIFGIILISYLIWAKSLAVIYITIMLSSEIYVSKVSVH